MESGGRKPAAGASSSSTSSSLSTDLFGPKESLTSTLFPPPNASNSSSAGIFGSVFPPASGVCFSPLSKFHHMGVRAFESCLSFQFWCVFIMPFGFRSLLVYGLGRGSTRSDVFGSWRKENTEGQAWNGKHASTDGSRSPANDQQSTPNKEGRSIFVDDTPEPCFLSSSLYYGGRDICAQSPSTRTSGTSSIFKKDGEEGEGSPPGASRGNWWQGGADSLGSPPSVSILQMAIDSALLKRSCKWVSPSGTARRIPDFFGRGEMWDATRLHFQMPSVVVVSAIYAKGIFCGSIFQFVDH
ncbi:hypothetical protein ACLOJK_012576 [Asimina triloba]